MRSAIAATARAPRVSGDSHPLSPGLRDPEDQGYEAEGRGDRSQQVQAAGAAAALPESAGAGDHGEPDREVDEEHGSPAEGAREDSADQQPARDPDARHRRVDREGLVSWSARGIGRRDQCEQVGGCERSPDALDSARGDQ